MSVFLHEFIWVLFFLGLFGFCGWFATEPFSQTIYFPLLLSPLVGLLLVVLGVSCFYSIFNLSVFLSLGLSLLIGIALSLSTIISNHKTLYSHFSFSPIFCLFIIAFIAIMTYLNCFSSISLGEPAFLYSDGADHLGYAQVADWLNTHLVSQSPSRTLRPDMPNAVYESWPAFMFYTDPRFGSFFTLAIMAIMRHSSSMFAYDMTCTIVLVFSYLGLTAIFSRTRFTFILLCLGLFTTFWFSYAHSGFLGKILGYPSTLLILGLFLTTKHPLSLFQLVILTLLTATVASVHCAMATAGFLMIGGGTFILLMFLSARKEFREHLKNKLILLSFLVMIIVITTGSLVAPVMIRHIPNPVAWTWPTIFPSLFDLEKFGTNLTHFSVNTLLVISLFSIVIILISSVLALKENNYVSAALLLAPLILLPFLAITHVYWIPQLIGIFYAWFLCGAIYLIDSTAEKSLKKHRLLILYSVFVLFHIPRLCADLQHYAGNQRNNFFVFTQHEMRSLTNFAKNKKITVDIGRGILILPILTEIGLVYPESLQFSDRAWLAVLGGYRDWPPQKRVKTPYYITLRTKSIPSSCAIELRTHQYYVLQCTTLPA